MKEKVQLLVIKNRLVKENLSAIVTAAIIIVALISCTKLSKYFTDHVTTSESDGLIVNCKNVYIPGTANDCWQPVRADILLFERGLKSFLEKQPLAKTTKVYRELSKYKRQYEGYIIKNRRILVTSFYHELSNIVREGEWKRAPVGVLGGGDDYFTIEFDIEKEEYHDFWINADA